LERPDVNVKQIVFFVYFVVFVASCVLAI